MTTRQLTPKEQQDLLIEVGARYRPVALCLKARSMTTTGSRRANPFNLKQEQPQQPGPSVLDRVC